MCAGFAAKRYFLQHKRLNGQMDMPAMNMHAGIIFIPVHRPWKPKCTALQTDRRQDYASIADHTVASLIAVRSDKNGTSVKLRTMGVISVIYSSWFTTQVA